MFPQAYRFWGSFEHWIFGVFWMLIVDLCMFLPRFMELRRTPANFTRFRIATFMPGISEP